MARAVQQAAQGSQYDCRQCSLTLAQRQEVGHGDSPQLCQRFGYPKSISVWLHVLRFNIVHVHVLVSHTTSFCLCNWSGFLVIGFTDLIQYFLCWVDHTKAWITFWLAHATERGFSPFYSVRWSAYNGNCAMHVRGTYWTWQALYITMQDSEPSGFQALNSSTIRKHAWNFTLVEAWLELTLNYAEVQLHCTAERCEHCVYS